MDKELIRKLDRDHVIYPWRPQSGVDPIIMDRCDGIHMWDADGNRYIDFCAGLLCVNIGHRNRHVLDAMKEQMEKMTYVGPMFASEPKARLAAMVSEVTPGDLNHVFFTNAGAEAIENSIKTVRWMTGRHKVYSMWRSYHGATAGAITLTGDPRRWAAEPGIPGVVKYFGPYCYNCPFGYPGKESCNMACLHALEEQVMLDGPHTIAAIFLEPIVGTNGILVPPKEYIQGVRKLCDEHGILMVSDEVMAGWGRSGKWFGIEHFDVVPDIMTVAKGITSGYIQLGAMIWSDKVYEHFCKHPFVGGLTYSGHALACAAGIANIEVYKEQNLVEASRVKGEYLEKKLLEMKAKHPSVGDVRCKGLWACVELTADRENKTPLGGFNNSVRNVMGEFMKKVYGMGLYLFAKWDFIFIAPPLTITTEEIDEAVDILDKGLEWTDSLL